MSIVANPTHHLQIQNSLAGEFETALVNFIELSKREGVAAAEHAAKIGIIAGAVFIEQLSGVNVALGILHSAQEGLVRT